MTVWLSSAASFGHRRCFTVPLGRSGCQVIVPPAVSFRRTAPARRALSERSNFWPGPSTPAVGRDQSNDEPRDNREGHDRDDDRRVRVAAPMDGAAAGAADAAAAEVTGTGTGWIETYRPSQIIALGAYFHGVK